MWNVPNCKLDASMQSVHTNRCRDFNEHSECI